MYDHLSQDPPPPGPEAREAVRARASRLRLRRRLALGGAGTTAVVAVAVLLTSGGEAPRSSLVVLSDPTPTPSPMCAQLDPDCPDGKPGWSGGFSGCSSAYVDELAPRSETLAKGVSVTLQAPSQGALDAEIPVKVVIRNETDRMVEVGISTGLSVGAGIGGPGGLSGQNFGDVGGQQLARIAPHSSYAAPFAASSQACGDTRQDGRTTLPAGDYTLTVNGGFFMRDGGAVRVLSAPFRLV